MVRIYRSSDGTRRGRAGYEALYLADIELDEKAGSLGFIVVDIPEGTETDPHLHTKLTEVFMALSPLTVLVEGQEITLDTYDVLVAEPGEAHSFRAPAESPGRILAVKVPNIKDDKLTPKS
ncbi:MAG: cupin domain-containing protein [Candidatus Thorarchaeota archaeon]